jgi:nucleotide-binding universal stress UspA family protein
MEAGKNYIIVVGIDYSDAGDLALDRAFELAAEKTTAEVHILHVMPAAMPLTALDLNAILPTQDRQAIEQATRTLREYADRRLQLFQDHVLSPKRLFHRAVSHLRFDAPAQELAQLASDLEADLVVVGTHGRRGAARLILGSVAEEVVRLAPCPVLVVRPKSADESVPKIEPPCPMCLEARRASGGAQMWCEQHTARHAERHYYHQSDRVGSDTNFPLIVR